MYISILKPIAISAIFLLIFLNIGVFADSVHTSQVMWGCATNEASPAIDFGCPEEVNIVTGPWLLDGWQVYHTQWLDKFSHSVNSEKKPYLISYMIAGLARRDQGLQDCDLTAVSICTDGANYIRENIDGIQAYYREAAESIADAYDGELYIHLEPDYYLYHSGDLQKDPLTIEESHTIMNSLISIIRQALPNAYIVMDVSSWNPSLASWHTGFDGVDYGGMVGKVFMADENPDGKEYSFIEEEIGVPLIVNTAHTYGGFFTQYQASWEADNHGVHAVIQAPSNNAAYSAFLQSISTSIIDLPYYQMKTFEDQTIAQNQ